MLTACCSGHWGDSGVKDGVYTQCTDVTHGMAESKSLMVRSGMTQGVCSMVTLLGEVFGDILGDVTWGEGEEGEEPGSLWDRGRLWGSLRGKEGEGEAQRTSWIAEFLWGDRLGAASPGGDAARSLWGRVHANHFPPSSLPTRPFSPFK